MSQGNNTVDWRTWRTRWTYSSITSIVSTMSILAPVMLLALSTAASQTRTYPDKIHGYKVERTVVEIKKTEKNGETDGANSDAGVDWLIMRGDWKVAVVTRLGC